MELKRVSIALCGQRPAAAVSHEVLYQPSRAPVPMGDTFGERPLHDRMPSLRERSVPAGGGGQEGPAVGPDTSLFPTSWLKGRATHLAYPLRAASSECGREVGLAAAAPRRR
jgi:hypothetical protein